MTLETTYVLEFSAEDLRILDVALGELPFRIASPLLAKINQQLKTPQSTEVTE